VQFQIDDGTGRVEVKQWSSDDETEHTSAARQALQEGKYVRVVGQLRSFQNERSVTAFNIRPVTDMNEITVRNPLCHSASPPLLCLSAFTLSAPALGTMESHRE
jgi:replication factor A2